jgi:hypothetical protein
MCGELSKPTVNSAVACDERRQSHIVETENNFKTKQMKEYRVALI